MKGVARFSFLLITILYGSFYAVAKEALYRIDPVIFMFFEVLMLAPIGIVLLIFQWKAIRWSLLKRGMFLGSWQCLGMLTMTVSLKFTQAANTAFFPSIGGIVGAAIAALVLKSPLKRRDWIAGGISLIGVAVLLMTSGGGIEFRGDFIALLGALFFTIYLFLVDFDRNRHQGEDSFWLILGIELLTMVIWMTFIVLLFGNWQQIYQLQPEKDLEIFVYTGIATTFVPIALSLALQKYIDPLEAAFISILEPIWGIIIAYLYLGEILPLVSYIGGALVIIAAVCHTWGSLHRSSLQRGKQWRLAFIALYRQVTNSKVIPGGFLIVLLSEGLFTLMRFEDFSSMIRQPFYWLWPNIHARSLGIASLILLLVSSVPAFPATHHFISLPKRNRRSIFVRRVRMRGNNVTSHSTILDISK